MASKPPSIPIHKALRYLRIPIPAAKQQRSSFSPRLSYSTATKHSLWSRRLYLLPHIWPGSTCEKLSYTAGMTKHLGGMIKTGRPGFIFIEGDKKLDFFHNFLERVANEQCGGSIELLLSIEKEGTRLLSNATKTIHLPEYSDLPTFVKELAIRKVEPWFWQKAWSHGGGGGGKDGEIPPPTSKRELNEHKRHVAGQIQKKWMEEEKTRVLRINMNKGWSLNTSNASILSHSVLETNTLRSYREVGGVRGGNPYIHMKPPRPVYTRDEIQSRTDLRVARNPSFMRLPMVSGNPDKRERERRELAAEVQAAEKKRKKEFGEGYNPFWTADRERTQKLYEVYAEEQRLKEVAGKPPVTSAPDN